MDVLLASLTAPLAQTEGLELAVLFYLPHACFIAGYGLDHSAKETSFDNERLRGTA